LFITNKENLVNSTQVVIRKQFKKDGSESIYSLYIPISGKSILTENASDSDDQSNISRSSWINIRFGTCVKQ
jgi:hypothetical protein